MQEAQDWCVQCGAARQGLLKHRPGWLTGVGVLAVTLLLVAGASVAAYAALTKPEPKAHKRLALLTPSTVTPVAPSTTTPTAPTTPGTPTTPNEAAPPKIPTQTPTPQGEGKGGANALFPPEEKSLKTGKPGKGGKPSSSNGSGGKGASEGLTGGGAEEGPKGESSGGSGSKPGESEGPEPILLDPNAASTYNPNAYPSPLFGDPSLTIDGDASTAWTAEVQASLAPQVNAGIVLDLRTAQKLASATIKTKTPGITIEMYGANGQNPPALIGDASWKKLHGARLLKKKKVTIKLATKGAAYRFVLLWIAKAPPGSTSAAPGKVAIREIELLPPS
ncbi:MAG: hypothetical protein ACTHM1_07820 [Solirubrobacteraceae bacterium]